MKHKPIVRRLLGTAFALSLLTMSAFAANADIPIDETNFPDATFRAYVQTKFDKDGNTRLSDAEIADVTELHVSKMNITSLKGVEHFSALTHLNCYDNQLTELDVSKNTDLNELYCYNNQLTQLDVSNNTALTSLSCHVNQLSALDVSKNTALTGLHCHNNQLTQLDVSNNTALVDFSCEHNQLTQLNVSNNTAITALSCSNNQLTQLDVSNNTALKGLYCEHNQLTQLDVSKNTVLGTLHCGNNHLTSLDLSNNPGIYYTTYSNNTYTVNQQQGFDYTTLPGNFDVSKVSNVVGGKFDANTHTFSFDADTTEATYDYATGHNGHKSVTFKLVYKASEPTEPVENPFTDISTDDYYYEPVLWAVKNDITAGVAEGKFAPNQSCTRAQIVTFLWASAGKPEPTSTSNPFTDVHEGDYYYKAVLWAVENKITAGITADCFGPDQVCNRAQTVTFLWASQGKPSVDSSTDFGDVAATDYFANAVKWAAENGVTAGVGGNQFAPELNCSRGQIVTFLYKAVG